MRLGVSVLIWLRSDERSPVIGFWDVNNGARPRRLSTRHYPKSALLTQRKDDFGSPSSRGLGHRPFTAVTGVRIP